MALTDKLIRSEKPGASHRYLTHKNGLQLSIEPSGAHFWRFHYRFKGQVQTLCIGKYPKVSIKDAENAVRVAREHIASGLNPRELAIIARLEDKVRELEALLNEITNKHGGSVK
ncbi:MAG: DUF4102 domain-containing protein [Moraxellaceae bacterium]|nr:MAG: DUF4102 domain-containing protein [Moraxellaceae bacterium]